MAQQQRGLLTSLVLQAVNLAQEFVIKNTLLEDKVNELLPSQGGAAAGVDLSASTMIVPVVNLTEAAEGSVLRQDLQSAFSHGTITEFNVANATTTIINTTGYWRVFGAVTNYAGSANDGQIQINDGTTTKDVFRLRNSIAGSDNFQFLRYDFIIKLAAGDSLQIASDNTNIIFTGSVRQIADVNGKLTNP